MAKEGLKQCRVFGPPCVYDVLQTDGYQLFVMPLSQFGGGHNNAVLMSRINAAGAATDIVDDGRCSSGPVRSVLCFWHCWQQHDVQAAAVNPWPWRSGSIMILFVSSWSLTVRPSWCAEVTFCAACLWSPPGFGVWTNPLYYVHGWPDRADWTAWFLPICPRLYVDDPEYMARCSSPAVDDLQERLLTCIDDIRYMPGCSLLCFTNPTPIVSLLPTGLHAFTDYCSDRFFWATRFLFFLIFCLCAVRWIKLVISSSFKRT